MPWVIQLNDMAVAVLHGNIGDAKAEMIRNQLQNYFVRINTTPDRDNHIYIHMVNVPIVGNSETLMRMWQPPQDPPNGKLPRDPKPIEVQDEQPGVNRQRPRTSLPRPRAGIRRRGN